MSAATLHFQAAPIAPTAICPAPCHELRMFWEDPTRELALQSIQFDVELEGASVAPLVAPPQTNSNGETANTAVVIGEENLFRFPFSVTARVGPSPDVGFDVRIVNGAGLPFTVESTFGLRSIADFCGPAKRCAVQLDALLANRIYLGRFNVFDAGPELFARVGGITGQGPGVLDPTEGVRRLNGSVFAVEILPEPRARRSDWCSPARSRRLGAPNARVASPARRAAAGSGRSGRGRDRAA